MESKKSQCLAKNFTLHGVLQKERNMQVVAPENANLYCSLNNHVSNNILWLAKQKHI